MSKSQSGFTLIEMMIAVVVICVLTIVGLPSFRAVLRSNRVATQSNTFIASVNTARAEAIKNNFPASVCTSDLTGATPTCSGSWGTGWIVFDDVNGNGVYEPGVPPTGDTLVRVVRASPDLTLVSIPGGTNSLTFNTRGMSTAAANVVLLQTPLDCATGFQGIRRFTLLPVGQLTITKSNCP